MNERDGRQLPEGPVLIVALDTQSRQAVNHISDLLSPELCRLKIGKELFTACGPIVVEEVQRKGFEVFLDLKYHDIPNTVAKAVSAAADLGVWMVDVHTSGGFDMMSAAREALDKYRSPPLLIGVTVLTSMLEEGLRQVGVERDAAAQVELLALLAKRAGLDGVVCSAREVAGLKSLCGANFLAVTPGIRPTGAQADDQKRTASPAWALENGSDFLVVGRPVTAAHDPLKACEALLSEMRSGGKQQ